MDWDKDIASLLDDVLQDKEPEKVEEPTPEPEPTPNEVADAQIDEALSSAKPATLEELLDPVLDENGDAPPVLVEAGTPGYFDSDCPDCGKRQACEHRGDPDVTSLVTEDETKAALPAIDMSAWSQEVDEDEDAVPIPQFTDDELMESIDVRNFGTLVSLTNRRWHAKIKDRKAAKDAAKASNADGEAYEARKRLLVGADEKLKAVHKCIDAARQDHYSMTLPWSTVGVGDHGKRAGPRLLPNTRFFEYVECMGKHKAEMESALESFTDAYPTLIAIAQQKLGSAFNQLEYPRPEVIEKHFALEFDFDPIPTGGDYQGLQEAQVTKLAAALQKKTQQKLENALADIWQRVYEDVRHCARVLGNPDAMFHYTLFDKLKDHASSLKHLNVVNNAEIENIRSEIEANLTKWDAKDVRDDDALRKRLADAATTIQGMMEEYAT